MGRKSDMMSWGQSVYSLFPPPWPPSPFCHSSCLSHSLHISVSLQKVGKYRRVFLMLKLLLSRGNLTLHTMHLWHCMHRKQHVKSRCHLCTVSKLSNCSTNKNIIILMEKLLAVCICLQSKQQNLLENLPELL